MDSPNNDLRLTRIASLLSIGSSILTLAWVGVMLYRSWARKNQT